MITLLHMKWRGGSTPYLVLYKGMEVMEELPISKERAEKLKARGIVLGEG
jgi:hypothetical protein